MVLIKPVSSFENVLGEGISIQMTKTVAGRGQRLTFLLFLKANNLWTSSALVRWALLLGCVGVALIERHVSLLILFTIFHDSMSKHFFSVINNTS
jgi:hypothetical protein